MKLQCKECNSKLVDQEGGYYYCENCDITFIIFQNELHYETDLAGFINAETFEGNIYDIMTVGEDE